MDFGPALGDSRSFFDEVTDYIGFGSEDSSLLRGFLPVAEPHFERISEHFYERIFQHPKALEVITGGAEQVERLKQSLVTWMRTGLEGPHDAAFCEKRASIGHIHVRIGLPQRYMITAMNVMRQDFRAVAREAHLSTKGDETDPYLERLTLAIERLCDLELAIMLETYKIEADDRLRRRERLATIGQLAASIGHDLRNPLSVIESSLYILRRRVREDSRATRHVERIANQITECDGIITHLLEMARNRPPRREAVRAIDLLDHSISAMRIPDDVVIERQGLADLELWVDGPLLKQAFVNLLLNSIQAQHQGERYVCVQARTSGEDVNLVFSDRGPGFDEETLPFVFDPLVTTKASGTGLGLALVKSVVERHGGSVDAHNHGEGATVTLHLPGALSPTS